MNTEYMNGFLGGLLIGIAVLVLLWFNGRVMGVSGIIARVLAKPSADIFWRLSFIGGLVLGGFVYQQIWPVKVAIDASVGLLIVAGLLVGSGTVVGSGCTSGHGICGIARLSKRSIVATLVFMAAGMLTVWLGRISGF